ncbi:MAG: nicotinamide-nucleotide amidohydrolase family protein [Proteobacteria bacterium]|nr:nicotinamide-nucleotide amidohydrolase family protein [Pseudomonadota bacterium]
MVEDVGIRDLAESLVTALSSAGKTVTTAESCTGGWIAKAITDIPGSSSAFAYGIVSYSNGAKESLLGVQNSMLAEHGAVSSQVVKQMAEGALQLSGADIAVAVSGVAGPDGGTDEKPVGTVCFAWAVRTKSGITVDGEQQRFDGNRNEVRVQTVAQALRGVLDRIES